MSNVQNQLRAGLWQTILHWLVWVFLFGAFMTMNESHAQKCTSSTVTVKQTLPTTMPFSFASGSKILGSYEATATLSGCSGYTPTRGLFIIMATSSAISPIGTQTASGRQFLVSGDSISCFVKICHFVPRNRKILQIYFSIILQISCFKIQFCRKF